MVWYSRCPWIGVDTQALQKSKRARQISIASALSQSSSGVCIKEGSKKKVQFQVPLSVLLDGSATDVSQPMANKKPAMKRPASEGVAIQVLEGRKVCSPVPASAADVKLAVSCVSGVSKKPAASDEMVRRFKNQVPLEVHVARGHIPYDPDCSVCQAAASQEERKRPSLGPG